MDKEYENVFSKAKAAYGTGAYDDATIEFLFPQLTKSEDDKAYDELVHVVNTHCMDEDRECLLKYLKQWKEIRGWKPTSEQIGMVTRVCNGLHMQNSPEAEGMDKLLKQLEKLYWGVADTDVCDKEECRTDK